MDRALVLLIVAVVFLFGAGCRGDSVKVMSNDPSLQTSKNESLLKETVVPKDDGGNKGSNGALEGEMKKSSGKKNDVHSDVDEVKPVKKTMPREAKAKNGDTSKTISVETGPVEECDSLSSNNCSNEKKQFIACLMVPGNDSPILSLLVQNKGTSYLDINIVAPDFVNIEKSTVSLLPRSNEKVKVSVEDHAMNKPIALVMGDWHCNLSFWDMIPDSNKKTIPGPDVVDAGSPRRISMIYAPLAVIFTLGGAYMIIRLRRRHIHEGTLGYQKLDMALPVSTGGVKEADVAEGWNDSWGDNWDDEEAPLTPSAPLLNLSSKGLASRKINKEGWKD